MTKYHLFLRRHFNYDVFCRLIPHKYIFFSECGDELARQLRTQLMQIQRLCINWKSFLIHHNLYEEKICLITRGCDAARL